ncbi:MAG: Na(+)-translocating NADH-quinone reductase subunit C [Plesiomonas sp.]
MAKSNDSIAKTLLVVISLSLVCSIIVAGSAVGLKATQIEQKQLDKQRNILSVAGLLTPNVNVKETFTQFIEPRLVDLATGSCVEGDAATFDQRAADKDPKQSISIPADQDKAKIKRRANVSAVYLVKNAEGKVTEVVLPVHGTGLWSMMYAFLAVETDGNTVKGITYYDQGETAGLGGEIVNPNWRKLWVGKKLFDVDGKPAIHIVKGTALPNDPYAIDGLSGATLTGNGVQNTFDYWLSANGYGPFLTKVRAGELNNG